MNPSVITPPASYPVTLDEAKEWARVFNDSQDGTLNLLIAAMTGYAEHLTGRAFVERTLELSLECFEHCIELPKPPLLAVESISYTDTSDAAQIVTGTAYEVDTESEPGRVRSVRGAYWPALGYGFNRVRIRYRAGYLPLGSPVDPTDRSYLPPEVRLWIAARLVTLYDNRAQFVVGHTVQEIPLHFTDGILDPLVIGSRIF